jgi:polyhydroxybutyrate depolymerase
MLHPFFDNRNPQLAGEIWAIALLLMTFLAAALAFGLAPASVVEGLVQSSPGCGTPPPVEPGETGAFSLRVSDLEREYRLHVPTGYDRSKAISVVLAFHSYNGAADEEETHTGLSRHADKHGYLVVYPQATAFLTDTGRRITSWNDLAGNASPGPEGPICSDTADQYPHPPECGEPRPCNWATCHNDLGFVERLLDRLEASLCIDPERIYATGMSNGGMFVHRLGCHMPNRFAAIAPVGGTLARGFNCAPEGSTPLSLMNIYGRRDRYVSQEGDMSSDGYYYTSAAAVMRKWAGPSSQGCASASTPYKTSMSGTLGLVCTQHSHCSTGAEVVNCIWDGGHTWPESESHDLANQTIWEFFSKHSRAKYRSNKTGERGVER